MGWRPSGRFLVTVVPSVGHNENLPSGRAPWWNNDFEVFIDVSGACGLPLDVARSAHPRCGGAGTTHNYKEFEINARNATYDVLWRVPDGGFSSPGVPCDQNVPGQWCTNSTYSGQTWTMAGPGGLLTQTSTNNNAARCGGDDALAGQGFVPFSWAARPRAWTVELALPIRGRPGQHGGLLDADAEHNLTMFDPNAGARYWWCGARQGQLGVGVSSPCLADSACVCVCGRANFARAEHPLLLVGDAAVTAPDFSSPGAPTPARACFFLLIRRAGN